MRITRSSESPPVLATEARAPSASVGLRPPSGPSFSEVLEKLGGALDRSEAQTSHAVRGASSGAELSPGGLIALQANIYRYVEAVDLATKLVDRATSAVKTTLQNQ